MLRQNNIFTSLDWFTIVLYLILVLMGWFNIYAAVFDEDHASIFAVTQRYGKQLVWIIAAIILAILVCLIDARFYASFAIPVYIISLLALIAVLIIGKEVNGSKSWFVIGNIQLQPSEFAKIATSLALAKYLGNLSRNITHYKSLMMLLVIIFLPPALIIFQPDTGSCLVYLAFILVLYREGLPQSILIFGILAVFLFIISLLMQDEKIYLILALILLGFTAFGVVTKRFRDMFKGAGIFAGVFLIIEIINLIIESRFDIYEVIFISVLASSTCFLIISLFKKIPFVRTITLFIVCAVLFTFSVDIVFDRVLSPHQQERILVMLGLESDPLGVGYNVNQSKIAIGSGGATGKGFLQGTQTKYNFVPEQSTDFIFCTVGEEWGFIGTATVVVLFIILLLRLLYISERQRSVFSRVYGYCVVSIMFLHVTINIGMTIGLVPVIGIPLPFFSYGGSSLWAFTILLFILLRLDASRSEYIH